MAEEKEPQEGNIKQEYNTGSLGLNMDSSVNQINPGVLTYALNASVENFDANSVNYQNEPGNEICIKFPFGFTLIGTHFIQEQNKHVFFLVNSLTGESEIGYMTNNDCVYRKLVNANCLNFNINYPIHKSVHRITNCSTEIYWTDGFNSRRYIDIDNVPYITEIIPGTCDVRTTNELDCNKLKIQPDFDIPQLTVIDVVSGGDLTAGTYQFTIQYADAQGNPYTSYYSITNPTPIADPGITSVNFNYPVGKSIVVNIDNIDTSGKYQYFNLAVIRTVNAISSVELVGTYYIDNSTKQITYTGQNATNIRLSINDVFEKFPYYDVAQDVTAVQDVLVWDQLTVIDRINYQKIANQISLQWETWRVPSTEDYADEFNATNLRGYLRDEVYAFEIVFLLKNGKQTDGFHIPGRAITNNEIFLPEIPDTSSDFIGEPTRTDPVTGIGYSPYWKIYNTASVSGTDAAYTTDDSYKGPYQYGEFAYWESTDTYPCNEEVWGDLANQPIRHHKFPDILVSPAFESSSPQFISDKYKVEMKMSNAIYPIGVKVDVQQIKQLISTSNLTQEEKDDIVGFKIVRGDRSTNKSIVAKGILRNVGSYEKDEQTYYYPNYPYNDLNEDVFLSANNTAYVDLCEPFDIVILKFNAADDEGEYMEIEYTDCNTNRITKKKIRELYSEDNPLRICSITKPRFLGTGVFDKMIQTNNGPVPYGSQIINYGSLQYNPVPVSQRCTAYCSYANYDVWTIDPGPPIQQCFVCWEDAIEGITNETIKGTCPLRVRVGTAPPFDCGSGYIFSKVKSRVVRVNDCNEIKPITIPENLTNRQIFNSPETSFGQPFLGDVLKLENVMYGAGKAHFVEVKNNAKYRLISEEAQRVAFQSSRNIAGNDFSALIAAYQAYLEIYINGITRRNFAYSFNSIASYGYHSPIDNNLGIKQRKLDINRYLIPGVQNVGDDFNINNYNRETSVYLKTNISLPFPSKTDSLMYLGNSLIEDYSRFTISGTNVCLAPSKEQDISVVSYYGSLKNIVPNQWGQIYSYEKVDTGCQVIFTDQTPSVVTAFGGDTFISKFAFKTKVPFFLENRVNAPDDSDVFYDEIGNIAYPLYWHSSRSILENAQFGTQTLVNFISYKATRFDCPNDTSAYTSTNSPSNLTYYDGFFYMFAYGVPYFYCESSYNLDLRQAFNNREGEFWPHVSTGIPDEWVQQSFVPIEQDNTYYYNTTFSKQNKENVFTNLPVDWNTRCFTSYPFRAIYSEKQIADADTRVNNWLIYRPISYFDFPQNYGNLVSLDGIQNRAILARFENKTLMYNNLLTIDTSNPQAAYVGNPNMFSAPPIDFAETDLGYVGSQNKFLLKIPQGQITVDAKRGQIFLVSGTQAVDLTAFGSGVNRFMTDHLAFEILRYYPNVDVDNHFSGIGLHGVYDSKFDRVIITKLDYIPLSNDIKYDEQTKEFYVEDEVAGGVIRTQVYLTDSEFFCNKSWTISFNFNTKSWVSFHSYIPNFYIGENNFFYSGLNGCCDDLSGEIGFNILVGPLDRTITTTTTTIIPLTTTSTTTEKPVDCKLGGATIVELYCDLDGTAVITVDPTPTTTMCQRSNTPFSDDFITGYTEDVLSPVVSTGSYEDACSAAGYINTTDPTSFISIESISFATGSLELGSIVYLDAFSGDCTLVPDGWYFTLQSGFEGTVYQVSGGVIVNASQCDCGTTTSTTTIAPEVLECCGILLSSNDTINYLNKIDNTIQPLDVPGYVASTGIAMTIYKLWSIGTDIEEWDITLNTFTATFNRTITLPVGFSTTSGIFGLNDDTILAVDSSATPQDVVELDVTASTAVSTVMFSLQTDRVAVSNPLYTTDGKFMIVNQDTISSDYYVSQYDYATTTLEFDINIGTVAGIALYECECNIYLSDATGNVYTLIRTSPYPLLNLGYALSPLTSVDAATQVASCIVSAIEDTTTTTTTTTSP